MQRTRRANGTPGQALSPGNQHLRVVGRHLRRKPMTTYRLTPDQIAHLLSMRAQQNSVHVEAAEATADDDLLHSGWYTTEEMSSLLKVDPSTLRRWRTTTPPQGPPFVKLASRHYVYSVLDAQRWIHARRIDPAVAA
jgi:hypothetical protein